MSALSGPDLPWDAATASQAFLETVKLRSPREIESRQLRKLRRRPSQHPEPDSAEFVSALAAGTMARSIIEVGSGHPMTTLALAIAAKYTGGRLISFLPGDAGSTRKIRQRMAEEWALGEFVTFESNLDALSKYEDVQFALINFDELEEVLHGKDCLKLDKKGALVVVDNLLDRDPASVPGRQNLPGGSWAHSSILPIGNGLEVVRVGFTKPVGGESPLVETTALVEVTA